MASAAVPCVPLTSLSSRRFPLSPYFHLPCIAVCLYSFISCVSVECLSLHLLRARCDVNNFDFITIVNSLPRAPLTLAFANGYKKTLLGRSVRRLCVLIEGADRDEDCSDLVESNWLAHSRLDGQRLYVLPILLQQRDEEVDRQHDVGQSLVLGHLDMANCDT